VAYGRDDALQPSCPYLQMTEKLKLFIIERAQDLRKALGQELSKLDDFRMVGEFEHSEAALEALASQRPDVIIIDIAAANCLQILAEAQRLNAANPDELPIGVLLISSRRADDVEATIRALEQGAFDFVAKPDTQAAGNVINSLVRQLVVKLRSFSAKRIFSTMAAVRVRKDPPPAPRAVTTTPTNIKAILVGVSTGGPKVLATLLPEICRRVDAPILVVQHMPPNFTASLAASLNTKCRHSVREASDGETVERGNVYIAPGGKQMRVVRNTQQETAIALSDDPPEDGCRPSVNVLFRSAAKTLGGKVIVVVLTGMGSDGAKGLRDLKDAGAYVLAQDKASSVVWGMPGSAVASGCVDKTLAPEDIALEIEAYTKGVQA